MKTIFNATQPTVRFEKVDRSSPELFKTLRGIFKEVLEPLYGSQNEALRKIALSSDRVCELMFDGDTPVGVLQYKTALQSEHGLRNSLEVKSLFLINATENSGKGLGSRLIARAEEVAQKHFARSIHLTVSENCPSSQEFFAKKGFQKGNALGKEYIPGVKEFLFTKRVAAKVARTYLVERPNLAAA